LTSARSAATLRPFITGRVQLEDIVEKGFEQLVHHKENNVKIIVSPAERVTA
jgi:(R,R)-butanediol dehydrogenase/meso-butanediol dehydrogenase/diacetyl reductase